MQQGYQQHRARLFRKSGVDSCYEDSVIGHGCQNSCVVDITSSPFRATQDFTVKQQDTQKRQVYLSFRVVFLLPERRDRDVMYSPIPMAPLNWLPAGARTILDFLFQSLGGSFPYSNK